jgi:SAM-dependent methyltransferase
MTTTVKQISQHCHFILLLVYIIYLHWTIFRLEKTIITSHQTNTGSGIANDVSIARDPLISRKSPPPLLSPKTLRQKDPSVPDIYGGKIDPSHLGGFIAQDNATISPNVWNMMLGPWAVKSFLDLGCGRGFSAKYFLDQGARVLCVEGSRDAIAQSLLPAETIIGHDVTLGPWWPEETFDVLWSTEFLEHVGRPFMKNYLPIMRRAAIIMITQPGWGGWHHVEVHSPSWWRTRMELQGFFFSSSLSDLVRLEALSDKTGDPQSIKAMMVFINPAVASLPQHHHLMGGHGCVNNNKEEVIDNLDGGSPCPGVGDVLPREYQSLLDCKKTLPKLEEGEAEDWYSVPWECVRNPTFLLGKIGK